MTVPAEVWLPAPAPFTRYEVSSLGRVRSYAMRAPSGKGNGRGCRPGGRTTTAHTLAPFQRRDGYMQLNLYTDDGRRETFLLHRLVLTTFLGPCPDKETRTGSHMDGAPDNNAIANLSWEPLKLNVRRQAAHGTTHRNIGAANPSAKLTADDVRAMRAEYAAGDVTLKTLADR
ncbi:MAG: NUMOD4 domain-containing protein, partial [Gaiellaceae bacterium]